MKQIKQLKINDVITWFMHENYQITDIKPPTRINGSTWLISYIGLTTGTIVNNRKLPGKSLCEFVNAD